MAHIMDNVRSEGKYYHPAANNMIDLLSKRESSLMQLESLIANARWAQMLNCNL